MEYGYYGAPGTCLWCGRRCRPRYRSEYEITNEWNPPTGAYANRSLCICDSDGRRLEAWELDESIPLWEARRKWVQFETGEPGEFICRGCGAISCGTRKRKLVSRTQIGGRPIFCTGMCAQHFGEAAARNGYRLKPLPSKPEHLETKRERQTE